MKNYHDFMENITDKFIFICKYFFVTSFILLLLKIIGLFI